MASPEYFPIDGAEEIGLYEPGCFHPIMIGDILNKRYHIVNKLGYKGYSTVWLVRDSQTENYVAVRVGVAEQDSSLRKETEVLRALSAPLPESSSARQHPGRRAVPVLLDEFELHGLKGVYRCYTMAPAGDILNDAASTGFFPLNVARALSVELVLAVSYTHSQGFVHGDIRLRNILVNIPSNPSDLQGLSIDQYTEKYELYTSPVEKRNGEPLPPNVPPEAVIPAYHGKRAKEFNLPDAHIFPSNFGEAFASAQELRRGEDAHTPLPSEMFVELQAPLSYSADIWSLGYAMWQLLSKKRTFSYCRPDHDEMINIHADVLGPLPASWWVRLGEPPGGGVL